jgi:hypothetical protein
VIMENSTRISLISRFFVTGYIIRGVAHLRKPVHASLILPSLALSG